MLNKIRDLFSKSVWYIDYPIIIIGCIVYALGFSIFLTPNQISPGGISGIAVVVHHYIDWISNGTIIIIFNIPLLIAGFIKFRMKFIAKTGFATILSSALVDVVDYFFEPYMGEKFMSAIAGGVLLGLGMGLIVFRGATTGGIDIAVKLINKKYPHLSFGSLFLIMDGFVVLISAIAYGKIEVGLFSLVAIFASSTLIDKLCYGSGGGKFVYIISKNHKALLDEILNVISRGVTVVDAKGGYTDKDCKVLMCAVRRYEVPLVNSAVKRHDPDAFVIITDSNEINGIGFSDGRE